MKYIIVFGLFGLFSCTLMNAQTSIVPFAAKVSNDEYNICQSVGEPVVSSMMSRSISLTQGFLQPEIQEQFLIYIPNIFSPNANGDNQVFRIGVKDNAPIHITSFIVFDNALEVLYEVEDIDPHNFDNWWDGTSGGNKVDTGIYRYQIELTIRGEAQTYIGAITKL